MNGQTKKLSPLAIAVIVLVIGLVITLIAFGLIKYKRREQSIEVPQGLINPHVY